MNSTSSLPSGWRLWLGLSVALYAILLLLTRPVAYVDTMNYALHIVHHHHGTVPERRNPMWDFGHLAWRPMGLALWTLLRPVCNGWFPGDESLSAACSLILWSIASGVVSVVFLFLTALRVTGKPWVAGVTAAGYISTAMAMNYALTGTAYMAGIACQLVALYLVCSSFDGGPLKTPRAWGAGLLLGASIAIWFGFILATPGFLFLALIWQTKTLADRKARIGYAARMTAAAAAVVLAAFIVVLLEAHFTTLTEIRVWMADTRHGISPTRGYLRMLAGIPRSFLWLGDDAGNWKRALMSGGHALTGLTHGLWKLLLVYAVLIPLPFFLRQSERGRELLVCLIVTAIPVLLFAAFLYDPSALERYIQLYPFLFLAFALILASPRASWFGKGLLPLFFISMLAANGAAMSRFRGNEAWGNAVARLQAINARAGLRDSVFVMTFQDDAYKFTKTRPFDSASRLRDILYIVIEPGTEHTLNWRQLTAETAFDTWERNGGRVFISLRLLAATPSPQWNWLEGDDPRIRWAAVPGFFRSFELGDAFGGPDGFAELKRSAHNEQILRGAL